LIELLLAKGHRVMVLSRRRANFPVEVEVALGDVVSGEGLAAASASAEAVIHLVGIIRETRGQSFEQVHAEGTRNVVSAAREAGVKRYLQMSALGAAKGTGSRYFETKARAEEIVKASGLDWTIFRPSLIFGRGDEFFGLVLKGLVSAPLIPQIGDGRFLFRPIYVGDVASAFEQSLSRPATIGRSFDLVGPTEYTFRELLLLVRDALGSRNPILPVPLWAMKLAVPLLQILPNPPITRDQFAMLLRGNTGDPALMQQHFDLRLEALPEHLPAILGLRR
jgi:NADH dehydrogenase